MKAFSFLGIFLSWSVTAISAQAATLDATGASGIVIGSTTYDVSFLSGSCASTLDGCDSTADFTFTSLTEATQASIALQDLIAASPLVQSPSAFAGCTSTTKCFIDTPYDLGSTGYLASYVLISSTSLPSTGDNSAKTGFPIDEAYDNLSFGVWTVADTPPAIPLPAGLPLLISGLLSLRLLRNRASRS